MSTVHTIFQAVVAAKIPRDHHESDLYIKATPAARELLKRYKHSFSAFTSQIDGSLWFDVPFAFDPWWEERGLTS
jgi:hypothetical protein